MQSVPNFQSVLDKPKLQTDQNQDSFSFTNSLPQLLPDYSNSQRKLEFIIMSPWNSETSTFEFDCIQTGYQYQSSSSNISKNILTTNQDNDSPMLGYLTRTLSIVKSRDSRVQPPNDRRNDFLKSQQIFSRVQFLPRKKDFRQLKGNQPLEELSGQLFQQHILLPKFQREFQTEDQSGFSIFHVDSTNSDKSEYRLQNSIHSHSLSIQSGQNEIEFQVLSSNSPEMQNQQVLEEEKYMYMYQHRLLTSSQLDHKNELLPCYSGKKSPMSKQFVTQKFDKGDFLPEQQGNNSDLSLNQETLDTSSTITLYSEQKTINQSNAVKLAMEDEKALKKNRSRSKQDKLKICQRYIELNKNFKSLKKEYPDLRKAQVQKYFEQNGNRKEGSGRWPDNLKQDSNIFKIFLILFQRGLKINQTTTNLAASIVLKEQKKPSNGRKNKWVKNFELIIKGESYYGIDQNYLKGMKETQELTTKINTHYLYGKLKLR